MGPKRAASGAPKRVRKVTLLSEKLKVCDKLREGRSARAVGWKFGANESMVRSIKQVEESIWEAVKASAPTSAKISHYQRDKHIIKMENALFVWMQASQKREVPLDTNLITRKALSPYKTTCESSGGEGSSSVALNAHEFHASRGWFENFKMRFSLRSLHLTGESGSADHQAAQEFQAELKQIINEEGYLPKQVFNMNETALLWKKMPSRTFLSRQETHTPGFKASKDRLSLLFCGNAAGHLTKPGLIYKVQNPRALKGKDKQMLPVFWMANGKA